MEFGVNKGVCVFIIGLGVSGYEVLFWTEFVYRYRVVFLRGIGIRFRYFVFFFEVCYGCKF